MWSPGTQSWGHSRIPPSPQWSTSSPGHHYSVPWAHPCTPLPPWARHGIAPWEPSRKQIRVQIKDCCGDLYLATLLSDNISALLGIVNLLTDLSGHRLALLSVHGVALAAVAHLPLALLLVDLLTLAAGLVLEKETSLEIKTMEI